LLTLFYSGTKSIGSSQDNRSTEDLAHDRGRVPGKGPVTWFSSWLATHSFTVPKQALPMSHSTFLCEMDTITPHLSCWDTAHLQTLLLMCG
jgi:hypothetical protein